LNVEAGIESRNLEGGFNSRLFMGVAFLLNPGDATIAGGGTSPDYSGVVELNTAMLYVGWGLGAAFRVGAD
jgi:hypothetical protein